MIKKTIQNILYVLRCTWLYEPKVIAIILLQVALGVAVPLMAIYLPAVLLDGITGVTSLDNMFRVVFGLLMAGLFLNMISVYSASIYQTYIANNKIRFLTDLFKKKMILPYDFIESGKGQNMFQYAMGSLLNDNMGITGTLLEMGNFLSGLMNLLLYISIIAVLNKTLVVILLVTSWIHFMILKNLLKAQHEKKDHWVDIDRKIGVMNNFIRNAKHNKDIKLFSMNDWLSHTLEGLIHERLKWVKKITAYDWWAGVLDVLLLIVRDGLAYFFIFNAIIKSDIHVSEFIFYFGAITNFSLYVTKLTTNFAVMTQRSAEVSGYRDYLKMPDGRLDEEEGVSITGIELKNVSFKFDDHQIIKNINMSIKPGERIALVGDNGAGKTTLVKLICGLYEPSEGEITFGQSLSLSARWQKITTVFQDIYVLPMSLAENIAFGSAEGHDEAIKHCLSIAGLEELSDNIHAQVTKAFDPEGLILSGGQKQKLVLARAAYELLYRSSDMLILDEPTAALDPLSEKAFYELYEKLSKDKMSLFISHRLASTQFCDRIFVLDKGEIIESGTHETLIKNKKKYYELYDIQSKYYKSEGVKL